MLRRGLESPYTKIFEEWEERARKRAEAGPELEITTQVRCGDFFEIRDEALKAHATQVDPNGFWFSCPLEVQRPRGRRRTIIWLGQSSIPNCPKMTCSPASGRG
jgi:LmbE family N-acetylglucosaminyl deacetylase